MPFSAPVLTYRAKGLSSNIQSKVLKAHNTLINIYITAILAPEITYTAKKMSDVFDFKDGGPAPKSEGENRGRRCFP